MIKETEIASFPDDDVIQDLNSEKFSGLHVPFRHPNIFITRRGIPARMVVDEHDGGCRLATDDDVAVLKGLFG